jgi:hypothetical protein
VNYTTIMDVLDGLHDGAHEAGGITMSVSRDCGNKRLSYLRFIVVTLGTYSVEEFSSATQVKAKIQVVGCLICRLGARSRNPM